MLRHRRGGQPADEGGLRLLLEHLLLSPSGESSEGRAAEVWRIRERTEREATALFAQLALDLEEAGAPEDLVALARRSAADEEDHARRCRAIVESLRPGLPPLEPAPFVPLSASGLDPRQRALVGAVAIGCVTESLSTALLIAMREGAEPPLIRETLHAILEDEVRHSRLGWAYLARVSAESEVSWLAPRIPGMIRAALPEQEAGALEGGGEGLPAYGILSRARAQEVCRATIEGTILPGLQRFGVPASSDCASSD